jgi:hypothetical protein
MLVTESTREGLVRVKSTQALGLLGFSLLGLGLDLSGILSIL